MRSVGIKALYTRLSEFVWLAASDWTISVTDRDRAVAELGPLRERRIPVVVGAFLAEAVRSDVLAPPALEGSGAPLRSAAIAKSGRGPARLVIHLDMSVALAWLLTEDRPPPATLWNEIVVFSRLLECGIWVPLNARGIADSHSEAAELVVQGGVCTPQSEVAAPINSLMAAH